MIFLWRGGKFTNGSDIYLIIQYLPQSEKLTLEKNLAEDRLNKFRRENSELRVRARILKCAVTLLATGGAVLTLSDRCLQGKLEESHIVLAEKNRVLTKVILNLVMIDFSPKNRVQYMCVSLYGIYFT